jgi:hypothetical protein
MDTEIIVVEPRGVVRVGWRWVLFVNVPVARAALVLAPAAMPESHTVRAPRSLDLTGALKVT